MSPLFRLLAAPVAAVLLAGSLLPAAAPEPQQVVQAVWSGPRPVALPQAAGSPGRMAAALRAEPVTRIRGYAYCGLAVASAQRCIDGGSLTLYRPAGVNTLAGHNYLGWAWMDDLPVGRKVVIESGSLAGTYRVYGHGWAQRGSRGGRFPSAGLGASVALQTCTNTGTGFSFLRRTSGS